MNLINLKNAIYKGARRSSGGVTLSVKKHLSNCITILNNEDDFSLWVKIENVIGGNSTICYITYIPPENSRYSTIELFDVIEYQYMCDICCIVYTWRQIVLSDDFLVTLEHDVTCVVMTSHEY